MGFQWACFLSYRHSDSDIGKTAVEQFQHALRNELALYTDLKIYRDDSNEPGARVDTTIATALCKSVCMVMLYWPEYFSIDHTYCTREYRAMVKLEEKRLAMLPPEERSRGLIIPVLIRGTIEDLPLELRDRIHVEFSSFGLSGQPMTRNKKFASEVRKVAQYIHRRYLAFHAVADDPCSGCLGFALEQEQDAKIWLDGFQKPPLWIRGGRP